MSRETKFLFDMEAAHAEAEHAEKEENRERKTNLNIADSLFVNLRLRVQDERMPLLQKLRPKHTSKLLKLMMKHYAAR